MTPEELPSSRDMKDAHPELQARWNWIIAMYATLWPSDPLPQVSSTYRGKADQDREVAEGSSKLKWPGSMHNSCILTPGGCKRESLALDFYFNINDKTSYPPIWMERVVNLSRLVGLFSGKTWGWDLPHLALAENQGKWSTLEGSRLPPIPELPVSVTKSVTAQPVIKYYDQAGTPNVLRGKGDVLIRVRVGSGDDPVVVHARYDEEDDGK